MHLNQILLIWCIGQNLVSELLQQEFSITIVSRKKSKLFDNDVDEVVVGDLCNNINWLSILEKIDCVIHLASIVKHTHKNSEKNIDINVLGCKNILELCKNIQNKYNKKINLVIASTVGTVACFDDNNMESNELSEYSKKSLKFPYYKYRTIFCKNLNFFFSILYF